LATSQLFQNLRKYTKGQVSSEELYSSDPNLIDIRPNTTKGLTRLIFDFKDNDQFFKFMNVRDDDAWFASVVTHPYSDGYNFQDTSIVEEDFRNGYIIFDDFSEENLKTFKRIIKVIDPGFDYSSFPDEESNKRAANILFKFFEKETNRLLDDWKMEKEINANRSARDIVESEIDKELDEKGFKLHDKFDAVSIDIGHLIMLYVQNGKIWLPFRDLFKTAFEDTHIGGWSDSTWEYFNNSDFDSESFNRDVWSYLDKLENSLDDSESFQDYIAMVDRITAKFKPGVWYNLPKLKGVQFSIKDFDKDNMKIDVVLRYELKSIRRKVSEENFYNLLYQPELFDFGFGKM